MAPSSKDLMRWERIVIAISVVVVLAVIAGGVWAARRGLSPADQTDQAAASALLGVDSSATAEQTSGPGSSESLVPGPTASSADASSEAHQAPNAQVTAKRSPTAGSTRPTSPSTVAATAPAVTTTPKPTKTTATSKPTPKPTKTAAATTVPAAPHFVVQGKVAKKTYFTLKQLKKMRTFSGDYFSRGKEPPEATTAYVGVRLSDILKVAKPKKGASKVTILAADDYSASFSMTQVRAAYIDETRPGITLPMIIAWSEDGVAYTGDHPFRLVMGQTVEGDYNRQYWVRIVVSVTVQ